MAMTNRERLNLLSNEDYELEIMMFSNCTVKPFVDYQKWLESYDEEYPIIGKDAVLTEYNGNKIECKFVESIQKIGEPYARLIVKQPGLHCFKMILVPESQVTKL